MEEVENLRERQRVLSQVSSSYHKVLDESDKCSQCDICKIKTKICIVHSKDLTKGKENLNLLLENKKASYNEADQSYEPDDNVKKFDKIFHA